MNTYDLSIIGAGWAGFTAALAARDLGLKVCLIEKAQIGGTCLNLGCIPTKTLIQSAKIFNLAKRAENFGLEALSPKIDFIKIQQRKDNIIQQLRQGMQYMLKGIDFLNLEAQILSNEELKAGPQTIKTRFILIACGSKPVELAAFKFDTFADAQTPPSLSINPEGSRRIDSRKIISSDDILNLKKIPNSLLIIGGGVIGCEFASLFFTLGTQVTIVEKMPQLLPGEDKEVARKIEASFKKRGIKVNTNTDALAFDLKDYSLVLVCVGRTPKTQRLGLENLGLNLDRGRIIVDEYLKTNIPNIYAAGDCTGKTMLAHFAAYQGKIAAQNIASPTNLKKADNTVIPNCIFTDPEIASVGLSEEKAMEANIDISVKRFDFLGSGMARILDETEGFIKIISDKKTEEVIGASIIGPRATELIAVLTVAISCRLKIPQVSNTIFAHPTLSESIHEALK